MYFPLRYVKITVGGIMKILHCSDIHLGAPLVGLGEKKDLRRRELVVSFCDLVSFAAKNADAMIVAGDLFDSDSTDGGILTAVAAAFKSADIPVFLIFGNHDKRTASAAIHKMPENVFTFDKRNSYNLGNGVSVFGIDDAFGGEIRNPDENDYNILILHGDSSNIDFNRYSNKPFDYVAMGHYHTFSAKPFARGLLCYCGSNEPRGFDDVGDAGFVIIDTQKKGVESLVRHDLAKRHIAPVNLDFTGVESVDALLKKYDELTADTDRKNYLYLSCVGKRNENVSADYLAGRGGFFAMKTDDKTVADYNLGEIKKEASLAGEFVRTVLKSGADEETTAKAIEYGLKALGDGK